MPNKPVTGIVFLGGPDPEPEASTPDLPPPESPDDLRAALGLPGDALVCKILIDSFDGWQDYGYPNWQDYIYEMVGIPARPTSPPRAPRITWRVATSHESVPVIALRRRVYCKGTPLYVEARWHPATGETLALMGLERDARQESVKRAHRGIKLLKAIESGGGRPFDTRYYSRDEFHAAYPGARTEAERRRGSRPRDEDLARALGISLSTMKRYLKNYGRPALP
jgi:hypothetical protein